MLTSPRAFRRKSGGGSFCCVPECSNESGTDKRNGVKRSYYRFPQSDSKQFKLWIAAIRRDKWEYRSWHRICSDHFKGGKKGHTASDPGYVPTIFAFKKAATPRPTKNSSLTLISPLKEANPCATPSVSRKRNPRKLKFSEPSRPVKVQVPHTHGHDYIQTDTLKTDLSTEFLSEIEGKIKDLDEAVAQNEIYRSQILDLNDMKSNARQIQFWTGFPNYETMYALFEFLEPRAKTMTYWRGNQTLSGERDSDSFYNKRGPERKLTLLDEFFLTMVRLKVGLLVEDLAKRFSVSVGTVSSIVTSWVNLMYIDLKLICELPPRDITSENQSLAMGEFRDVQVILDCTELFVQNPSKLDARKQVFSNYKHHNTYKFLVGISPQMGITYISKMYGGRASDKFITSDSSNLLLNLEQGKGSVMADRGFLVQGILGDMGVKLHMPTFKGQDRPQLSAAEGDFSQKISSVRIHIERAIQRIKTFHILDGELKLSMKDIAEQVFTVCAYLVNFQTPLVRS